MSAGGGTFIGGEPSLWDSLPQERRMNMKLTTVGTKCKTQFYDLAYPQYVLLTQKQAL